MLQPTIKTSGTRLIAGMRMPMSFADFRPGEVWRRFMPLRERIPHAVSDELLSVAVYAEEHFREFRPDRLFDKWAAKEVTSAGLLPDGMETLTIPAGLYAVFHHKGLNTDKSVFSYIFGSWMPGSEYEVDQRPHFEVLGEKYRNNDPESEEEIWVPVCLKRT